MSEDEFDAWERAETGYPIIDAAIASRLRKHTNVTLNGISKLPFSLDASILGDALDALREQAVGGRLVGVISHLHAVAAEVEDVLVVSKTVEGSDFRWLDDEERDQYLLDEQAAGLLG